MSTFFMILMLLTSLFMITLILLQRGKGGGLAGAPLAAWEAKVPLVPKLVT